ncbi:hypothetical protein [Propionicimonas sp.]|uniref:hypothetical protein n=1 Tax=Propionicimonas sp. TaxID=1955623 RepID=UPI0017BFDE11|nr:hypothetical protein [Propionicimonas sp.]MBU3976065.1 hypothetical protein [Actinomycetota bacterium]MBA3020878.1 hypothetical protein [Propionicimonas sp.]MBU3985255.1 hypothetical protein [Actinomycetota bacterium]MBU4008245.1 hypothetical protein [Actinomycetota bacterium]MBU4064541.1 hypothetical protein [Actinomycetota bacterium]
MSDQYGQSPWGQAPQQPQQPAGGYPAAPPPPGPVQPWVQPTPGGYGQPYQPPVAYGAPPAPNRPRSPILGVISLAFILIATALSGYGAWLFTNVIAALAMSGYSGSYGQAEIEAAMRWPISVIGIAGSIGMAAWIAAIVATATNRGRILGVIGIILGVLAPIGVWTYIVMAFAQLAEGIR